MLRWLISLLMTLRGYARAYIKDVEKIRATAIIDIIHSGEQVILCVFRELWLWHLSKTHTNLSSSQLTVGDKAKARCPEQGTCVKCGYISSQEVGMLLKKTFWEMMFQIFHISSHTTRFARHVCFWPVWTRVFHSLGSARAASTGGGHCARWCSLKILCFLYFSFHHSGRHLLSLRLMARSQKEKKSSLRYPCLSPLTTLISLSPLTSLISSPLKKVGKADPWFCVFSPLAYLNKIALAQSPWFHLSKSYVYFRVWVGLRMAINHCTDWEWYKTKSSQKYAWIPFLCTMHMCD